MINLFEKIKKNITIKLLLFFTALALIVISVNYTFQSFQKREIEKNVALEKIKDEKIIDSISKSKIWYIDSTLKKELNIKQFIFTTKYNEGEIYFKFRVLFNELSDKRFITNNVNDYFIISFRDKDDFSIYTHNLIFSDMALISDNNKIIGAEWESNFEMSKILYYSFSKVRLGWNF